MPPDCPYAPRIAAQLAGPAARLDDDLARHLPGCEACRTAASVAIRAWPTNHLTSPSLAEWLRELPAPGTVVSQFQAEAIVGDRVRSLELGPYLLLDRLGTGGMGDVYRAWHRLLRREDAVKTVRPEFAANAGALKRFLREAEAAAKLRHPNVVQVYTADRAGPGYYLAMEFVPGTDLGKLVVARGPLPVPAACAYVRQAADGLHHAYTSGLVHRDVKPANLLVTKDGRTVKVADFGLARAFEDGAASEFTSTGAVLGTTDYMAPEQAEDAHAADTRSDVYALGCTLYFLLAGEVPYPGGSLRNKLERHATAPLPDVTARRPDVPSAVGAIVRKCMAKRPEDRYQTPGELSAALRALDPDLPRVVAVAVPAKSDPFDLSELTSRDPPTEVASGEAPRERDEPRRRESARVWLWAGAAVLLALGAAAVAALKWPKGGEGAKADPPPVVPPPKPAGPPVPAVIAKMPDAKRDAAVPIPRSGAGAPWKFTTACWSARTDKVRAVGFLADGAVGAGREGGPDGTDAGYWEVWPATGGSRPLRAARPRGAADYEFPSLVQPDGSLYAGFRRIRAATLEPQGLLSMDMTSVDRGSGQALECLVASGDNKFLAGSVLPEGGAVRGMRLVVQWEADTGAVRTGWQVKTAHDLRSVAVDRIGQSVAVGTIEGKIAVLGTEANRGREWTAPDSSEGTPDPVSAIAMSPSGGTVYSAHAVDKRILIWRRDEAERAAALPVGWLAIQLAVSPDDRWLAAVGSGVIVWDLHQNPPRAYELAEDWTGDLLAVAFAADSSRLAVGGWARRGKPTADGEGVVWLWDLKP